MHHVPTVRHGLETVAESGGRMLSYAWQHENPDLASGRSGYESQRHSLDSNRDSDGRHVSLGLNCALQAEPARVYRVFVRLVANRSVHLRPALPVFLIASAEDVAGQSEHGVGSVTSPAHSRALAAFRMQGYSKPATKHLNRDAHPSAVTGSRTYSRNSRASPRNPRRAPRSACRDGPDRADRARSAESWRSGRRRSRRSAGTPRFLQAPPPT